jgi:Spy/CpxP family protein refolding chaperone
MSDPKREKLEAEARTFGNEWGNKPGIDRGKQAEALADLMERIQSDAAAEERLRLRNKLREVLTNEEWAYAGKCFGDNE